MKAVDRGGSDAAPGAGRAAGAAASGRSMGLSAQGRWVLVVTVLASGMAFLSGSMLGIALPAIQDALGATLSQIQWVVNAYSLSLAALILVCGSMGDRFGRRRIFTYGMAVFVAGALLSAASRSIAQLIAFQGLQGLGAAMMVPGSLAIINTTIEESHRGQAIGWWAGLSGAVGAFAPYLGGFLVQTVGWRSIFLVTAPLGALAMYMTLRFVPESRDPQAGSLDLRGTMLLAAALFGLSYGLISGPTHGWADRWVLTGLIGGGATFVLFLVTEALTPYALVPFSIFRNPLVAGANLATLLLYFALSGFFFLIPLNLQQIQGMSPSQAGLGLMPAMLLLTFLSGPAGRLSDRIGPRTQMIVGPLIVAAGYGWTVFSGVGGSFFVRFLPGIVLIGLGMALLIPPLTKSALSVEPRFSGLASGLNNAVARIAGMLAIAVLGALTVSLFAMRVETSIGTAHLTRGQQQQVLNQKYKVGAIKVPAGFSQAEAAAAGRAIKESFAYGFRWVAVLTAALALLAAAVSAYFIRNPRAPGRRLSQRGIRRRHVKDF